MFGILFAKGMWIEGGSIQEKKEITRKKIIYFLC